LPLYQLLQQELKKAQQEKELVQQRARCELFKLFFSDSFSC
jgi:hypothetical protein